MLLVHAEARRTAEFAVTCTAKLLRVVMMVLGLVLLPVTGSARAQGSGSVSVILQGSSPTLAPMTSVDSLAPALAEARRDRLKGAGLGVVIGAVVGGVGPAVYDRTTTISLPKNEYTAIKFFVGAVTGGIVGGVVGALIGMPGRSRARSDSPQLQISPGRSGTRVGVSMPMPR